MQQIRTRSLRKFQAHPILKWAGGKGQLLSELMGKVPATYGKYIEPFFGGGRCFSHCCHHRR
ncbi:DNA adenine methylase [Candidatus Obscuribacterales bacterium]|nr:DNA adenine methylase [Candidatus Obscuribacterales bacterium]MBX3139004.1 DNA adenine methylase [Candidatus Obscuribacterales bacterium]MBX3153489.1 DNA adenine methylase [Candidatus Obscuribacterales bacterium]